MRVALVMLMAVMTWGCSPGEVDVDLETPENAARSVGRVLCAEHRQRVEAIQDSLQETVSLQTTKQEILADSHDLSEVNKRLNAIVDLFDDKEDELLSCEIVLTDRQNVSKDTKVHLSMKLVVQDIVEKEDDALGIEERVVPVLMTLTQIDGAWKVSSSSVDFGLPGGALRSLMD